MKDTCVLVLIAGIVVGPAAFAQDKVGVELCDTFLDKYQACVKDKAGDQRAQFEQMIGQLRAQWKQLAADPQTKPSLETACKQTIEAIKPSLNAAPYNCGF
ncbi:MAG: hypothetical protein ACHQK9_07825 [Reyranellales bacterium]